MGTPSEDAPDAGTLHRRSYGSEQVGRREFYSGAPVPEGPAYLRLALKSGEIVEGRALDISTRWITLEVNTGQAVATFRPRTRRISQRAWATWQAVLK